MNKKLNKHPAEMIPQTLGWSDKFGVTGLVLVVVITAVIFFGSKSYLMANQHSLERDTWIDESGKLHVLGLSLGTTTLREAEILLKSRSDTALYIKRNPSKENPLLSLESFFPSIADHSKVILGLEASKTQLEKLKSNATIPHMYPSGVARMNLSAQDSQDVQKLKVKWIKLVPSLDVDHAMLHARFGQEDRIEGIHKGKLLYFSKFGLIAELDSTGKDTLTFQSPGSNQPATADPLEQPVKQSSQLTLQSNQ